MSKHIEIISIQTEKAIRTNSNFIILGKLGYGSRYPEAKKIGSSPL